MSSSMLRRFALGLAAAGAILAGSASDAQARRRTVIVTHVVHAAPVVVYRHYAPRVVHYSAPVVDYRVRAPRHHHYRY